MQRRVLPLVLVASLAACHGAHEAHVPPPLVPVAGLSELADRNPDPMIVELDLVAAPATMTLRDGGTTEVLAFNGSWPGPLIHARVGDRVIVHFTNQLDEATTIHWHGLRIDSAMDGSPIIQRPIEPGQSFTYDFVVPDAGTFWYHPHAQVIEHIERGLYGLIVVEEQEPPVFTAERAWVLDDLRLDASNQIAAFRAVPPDAVHGRYGNLLLVNGVLGEQSLSVAAGAIERWRLLNAATAQPLTVGLPGARFRVIGTDGGLLPAPYETERVTLAAGQRYDLEVSFAAGDAPRLEVYLPALDADNQVIETKESLLSVSVAGSVAPPTLRYPAVTLPSFGAPVAERSYALSAQAVDSRVEFSINGHVHDLPVEHFRAGEPVLMTLVNEIGPQHPFHLHGQFFQILERNGVPTDEPGLKDTVLIEGLETVKIVTGLENPGRWMFHCHIPEHSEGGMMAEIIVDPSGSPALGPEPAPPHDH
jgi:FtsP/CotA-like multicopper oxidase with cupredoxin domain